MYRFLPIWTYPKVMCHSARFLTYSKKLRSSTLPSSMMKTQRLIGVTNFNSIFPSLLNLYLTVRPPSPSLYPSKPYT